ncbi:hypothetical protein D3C76_947530 [compost metagenome]
MQVAFLIRTTGTDQFQIETIREVFFVKCDALINQHAIATDQAFADITHAATRDE